MKIKSKFISIILACLASLLFVSPILADEGNYYSSSSDGYLWATHATYATVQAATTGYVNDSATTARVGQNTGYYIYRSAVIFDTGALPDNAVISAATLSLYGSADSSATNFAIHAVDGGAIGSSMASADYYAIYSSNTTCGSMNTAAWSTAGYNDITLNAIGRNVISTTDYTKFALRSEEDMIVSQPAGLEYVDFFTAERGPGYKPRLIITYTVPGGLSDPDELGISDVSVFHGYLETGDRLVCVTYDCDYADKVPAESPRQYFDLMLMDATDNITAQTKIPAWGHKPVGIYVADAEAFEWGGTFSVNITGSNMFTTPPSFEKDLVASDWSGYAGIVLEDWVFNTALELEDYYGDTYIEYDGSERVLNAAGGSIFLIGFPNMDYIHPEWFLYPPVGLWLDAPPGAASYSYQEQLRGGFGTNMTATFASIGTTWGIGGAMAGGLFWGFIMLVAMGIVVAVSGNWIIGTAVTLPILFVGAWMGAIDLVVVAVLTIIAAVMLIISIVRGL